MLLQIAMVALFHAALAMGGYVDVALVMGAGVGSGGITGYGDEGDGGYGNDKIVPFVYADPDGAYSHIYRRKLEHAVGLDRHREEGHLQKMRLGRRFARWKYYSEPYGLLWYELPYCPDIPLNKYISYESLAIYSPGNHYVGSIEYPQFGIPAIDGDIQDRFKELLKDFETMASYCIDEDEDDEDDEPCELGGHVAVVQYSDTSIDFIADFYEYTGGAHGESFVKAFMYDIPSGSRVTAEKLQQMYPSALPLFSQAIRRLICQPMEDNPYCYKESRPIPENFKENLVRTPEGMMFYFNSYDLGTGHEGTRIIEIPWPMIELAVAP